MDRPGARALALGAIVALASLLWPALAASHGPAFDRFGIVSASYADDPPTASDFQLMRETGMRTYRVGFAWYVLEPERGTFDWSTTDAKVGPAAAARVKTVPTLLGSPGWALGCNSNPDCRARPPIDSVEQRRDWVIFLNAVVSRYGPGGSYWTAHPEVPYLPIRTWQIWSEPNMPAYYQPRPSAHGYAKLVRISAKAIRNVDPEAQIVLGGLGPGNAKPRIKAGVFLKRLYRVPRFASRFDVAAVHPYARRLDGVKRIATAVRKAMSEAGDRRKPLWITEIGWSSAQAGSQRLAKGLQGQAAMVRKSFRLFLDRRKVWRVRKVFYFSWKDTPLGDPDDWARTAGLHYGDLQPKPAWNQLARLMRRYG